MNRSLVQALATLLLVLGALLAVGLWWRDQLRPDLTVDRVLRLAPEGSVTDLGPLPMLGGTRHALLIEAGQPGLRFQFEVPADDPELRLHQVRLAGLPELAVSVTRADGSEAELARWLSGEDVWTRSLVPLDLEAGESVVLELKALDGRGRSGLGRVAVADVVLLSAGRAVDERAAFLPVTSLSADLLANTATEQRRAPATLDSARVDLPGPRGLALSSSHGLELVIESVPPDASLELVVHTARTTPGPLLPTRVSVMLGHETVADVRVDEAADPPGDEPPFHQQLVSLDLGAHAGQRLPLRLDLRGGENLTVSLVEALVVARSQQPRRRFDPVRGVNLVLLVVEGLRADRLSPWGYTRGHTPNLDALAERGMTYTRVIAPSSWGLPNLATLLTGTSPVSHGLGLLPGRVLSPQVTTLARSAGWAGLMSSCFVSSTMDVEHAGLMDGYGTWAQETVTAPVLTERALDWVTEAAPFQWFLTLVLSDPTWPHEPESVDLVALDPQPDPDLLRRLRALDSRPGSAEALAEELGLRHDAEIARVDRALGMLTLRLEELGLLERTVIAVVGLHGQEFHDHGGRHYGHTLNEELVHVPVIVAGPGVARPEDAPVTVRQPVALGDVTHLVGHVGRILSTGSVPDRVPPPYGPDRPGLTIHSLLEPFPRVTDRRLATSRRDELLLLHDGFGGERRLYDLSVDPLALDDLLSDERDDDLMAGQAEGLLGAFQDWFGEQLEGAPARPRRAVQ